MFIGIDPSISNTGVVVIGNDGNVTTIKNSKHLLKNINKNVPYYELFRYRYITDSIIKTLKTALKQGNACDCLLTYEAYSYNSTNLPFTIGEFNGILKLRLVEEFSNITLIEPTKLKKFATGTGNATKQSIITQAKIESGYVNKLQNRELTDDVCDAFFLAKIAMYIGNPNLAVQIDNKHPLLRERLKIAKEIYGNYPKRERSTIESNSACKRTDLRAA
jgi:Holliday junction resolvasome RuvABC endonuclease subunit